MFVIVIRCYYLLVTLFVVYSRLMLFKKLIFLCPHWKFPMDSFSCAMKNKQETKTTTIQHPKPNDRVYVCLCGVSTMILIYLFIDDASVKLNVSLVCVMIALSSGHRPLKTFPAGNRSATTQSSR